MIQNASPTSAHMLGECFDHKAEQNWANPVNVPRFSGLPRSNQY
jgi:hypothetical protein